MANYLDCVSFCGNKKEMENFEERDKKIERIETEKLYMIFYFIQKSFVSYFQFGLPWIPCTIVQSIQVENALTNKLTSIPIAWVFVQFVVQILDN